MYDFRTMVSEPIPNFEKIAYTLMHRQAFRFVLDTRFSEHPLYYDLAHRAAVHDLDKVMALALGMDPKEASQNHRRNAPHHMEFNSNPTELDLMEAIIDYECAGFTKADKPLNAYDTIIQWNKPHAEELVALLAQYGMDKSYENTPWDPDWMAWIRDYTVTEDIVMAELDTFCQFEPVWAEQVIASASR